MIGSLSQLIRGAAILAIADGSEQITRDLLEAVPVDYDQRAEPAAARTQQPVVPALPPRRPRHLAPRPHPARPDPRLVTLDGRHRRHHLD
jgi:hypothetical protein